MTSLAFEMSAIMPMFEHCLALPFLGLEKDLCQHAAALRTIVISVPDFSAGRCRPMSLPETLGHSQASLVQSLVESLLLSPGSWCTRFVCSLQESVSQSCGISVIKCHWPSNSLGVLSPFAESPV